MIALDASFLIAHFSADDAHHERAVQSLEESADDALAVSTVTLAELLVGPVRSGTLKEAIAALAALELSESPLPNDAAVRLARLRAETRLRLPDCCVLLAAEEMSAEAIGTFDQQLSQAAKSRGIRVIGHESGTGDTTSRI